MVHVNDGPFQQSHLMGQFQWRHYALWGKSPPAGAKGDQGGSSAASSGDGDGDDNSWKHPPYDLDEYDDEFSDDEKADNLVVPRAVPDFFPRVPIIATAYPVFPKFMKVFEVSDPRLIKLLEKNFEMGTSYAGVFTRKNADGIDHTAEVKSVDDVHKVGTFVQITEMSKEGNKLRFVATAYRRIEIKRELFLDPKAFDSAQLVEARKEKPERDANWNAMMVETKNLNEELPPIDSDRFKAVLMEVVKTIRDIIMANTLIRDNLYNLLGNNLRVSDDPSYLADLAASITSAKPDAMQEILNEADVGRRMEIALELLKQEKQVLDLQKKIGRDVEDKVKKTHREFMLREQLKAVKKELGLTKDDNVALDEKFRKALEGKTVPKNVLDIIDEELNKLAYLEPNSTEFS